LGKFKEVAGVLEMSQKEVLWEWKDDHGWVKYDNDTIKIIEKAFADGKKNCLMNHGFFGQQGWNCCFSRSDVFQVDMTSISRR